MDKNYFGLNMADDTTVLIDGANIFHSNAPFDVKVDYAKLRKYFEQNCKLVRILYYSVLKIEEDEEDPSGEKYNPIKPLLDWLSYNGFQTVIKNKFVVPDQNRKFYAGNMNTEIATDIVLYAQHSKHIVIFGGANDWVYPIEKAKTRFGTKFTACSVIDNSNTFGDELRRAVDIAVDMSKREINSIFAKADDYRPARQKVAV